MKNTVAKICFISLVFAMLFVLSAVFFAPANIARADDSVTTAPRVVEVAKAPVSNLEGNATAGKSSLFVYEGSGDKKIFIPESYFLSNPVLLNPPKDDEEVVQKIYQVDYSGKQFIYEGDLEITQIAVSEDESLYPTIRLTLKEDATVTVGRYTLTNEYAIDFLGYNEDGTQLYISANAENKIPLNGFIPADSVEDFSVPYQKKTQAEREALLASKKDPIITPDGNFAPNTSVALRIIIIIGIAIPTLLIVILLFKPSKNDRRYAKKAVRNSREREDIDYDHSRPRPSKSRRYEDEDDGYDDGYSSRYDERDRYSRRDDYDRNYDRYDDRYDDPPRRR